MTSARDLEATLSPAKKPLLDNAPMTINASAHTDTPLAELTCLHKLIFIYSYTHMFMSRHIYIYTS
jgi:hypothetical protein